ADATCISAGTSVTINAQPTAPTAPTASATLQPTCAVATGTIEVSSPASGTGFEYSIDGTTYQLSPIFANVASGTYSVTVRSLADATCISAGTSVTINAQPVAPVMSFNKTATILGPVVAGTIIQYNFEIQNLGTTTVSDLVISDPTIQVPSLLVADVPAGGVSNVSHNYIITQADIDSGLITNSATLSGVGVCGSFSLVSNDPSTPITDDPTITILTPAPTMTLVKTSVLNTTVVGDPAVANVGDTIQYSFVVTNTGNVTLSNVV
ncbi:DUF7507 domain-containing protein, partial [Flavobacterium sp.]|uniref:DUF7507 domain-containing protein n=1 Tax=Flavobacterium sp. TaxID=239 RepID=UPI003B9DA084